MTVYTIIDMNLVRSIGKRDLVDYLKMFELPALQTIACALDVSTDDAWQRELSRPDLIQAITTKRFPATKAKVTAPVKPKQLAMF